MKTETELLREQVEQGMPNLLNENHRLRMDNQSKDGSLKALGKENKFLNRALKKAQRELDTARKELLGLAPYVKLGQMVDYAVKRLGLSEEGAGMYVTCSLMLISNAVEIGATKSTFTHEGVTICDELVGDWKVTIEKVDEVAP